MFKTTLALLSLFAIAPSSYASHYKVEQVLAEGSAKHTEISAKWAAENEVHRACKGTGGRVIFASTSIVSCWYAGYGHHQCKAECGCKVPY